ncbi:Arc family DNA-binding protein [Enterobacter kobei]|uniref:Arc family DNA-binding protein n=3 Tax=Enterobacteriaceae TaxID=543 RepID=UPI00070C0EB1|nr:Arc family DNA-binding protein [Enterobacter kobei]
MKVRDIAPYGVRMPAELKDKLQSLAKKNGRSLNSEIVHILEEHVNPPKIDFMRPLSDEEIRSPEKIQRWMSEMSQKIAILDQVVSQNYPEKK